MGKAERNRARSARERIAAQQAAAHRQEMRRRALMAGGSVFVVIAIVVGLIVAKSLGGSTKAPKAKTDVAVATQVTSIPASVFNSVGAGPTGKSAVNPLAPISGQPLTENGKPEVLYMGAEYCPYCAAERWAMTAALSRFGTFSGLHFIHSSSSDVYSNTSTLSFYKSTYTSNYVAFTPVEMETVTDARLQTPTSSENAILSKYDAPPYVSSTDSGAIPFVDLGGKYLISGSQYLPSVLGSLASPDASHHGLTWSQIAADMKDPGSPVAQSVIGAANHITAAICKLTNGQPGSVCTSAAVKAVGSTI
jgi:thiol-disulfide isomerase/thioredoxin